MKGPVRGWQLVLLALLVAVCSLVVLRKLTRRVTVAATQAPAVATVTVQRSASRELERTLEVTGSVTAVDPLVIGSEINGLRVEEVRVEEGDQVQAGQVLATLNSSVLRAQLQALQARLEQSRAGAAKARQPNRPQELASLQAAYAQARAAVEQEEANLIQSRATLAQAEQEATRYRQSLSQGFVTEQEAQSRFTEAERQRALLQASLERARAARYSAEQARQRLAMAREGGRPEDVAIAEAGTQEIAAQIAQVEAQLAQTVIRAPDSGLITQRNARLGQVTSGGTALFAMVRENRLELRAEVPDQDLDGLRVGEKVEIRWHEDRKKTRGRVWQLSPQVNPDTRLGTARIEVSAGSGLRPGMFVKAVIELGSRQALTVPAKAVLGDVGRYYVLVLDEDVARRRPVQVGLRSGDQVEIASGLEADVPVIVDGAGFLQDGDRVEVR